MPSGVQLASVAAAAVSSLVAAAVTAQDVRTQFEKELIGAPAYSIDGTQIGEVEALEFDGSGEIEEVRVVRMQRLGLGGQTITLSRGQFLTLRGAVVIELTAPEIFELPAEPR